MPILDLLASITGEKPAPSPNPVPRPSAVLPKRKAEDDLRTTASKTARTDSVAERPSRVNGEPSKASTRPSTDKPSLTSRPVPNNSDSRDKSSSARSVVGGASTSSANGNKSLPSRPATSRPAATESAPPKKRSFAEIMARAKANSELRESLGKIQHKTIERGPTMKERKEMKAEEARMARMAARKATPGKGGVAATPSRDASKAPGSRVATTSGSTSTKKSASAVEEKKVKKAALATTGYTGTARPRPAATAPAKTGATSRPSSVGPSRDKPRYGGPLSSSRRRYEDEDDDLDDFIEYDEEDEEPGYGAGRRYRYDSYDDESDMEAGLSDIEDEETRAERYARREDQEQEELEKRLKREKEERKRRFLEASKAKAGGR
ncbi:hypothetical protein VTK26DRAFT_7027 [Humicola hyalothermophila]